MSGYSDYEWDAFPTSMMHSLRRGFAAPPSEEDVFSVETRGASPAHLLLKIEKFSLFSENEIDDYESRVFEAGGHKWRVVIYPNGDKNGKESGHISVCLSMVDTDFLPVEYEVNVMFNVFLFNQIRDNYTCFRGKVRRFNAINNKWGFSKLISKNSFTDKSNGYLVDDNCVFGAEVFVVKRHRVIERVSVKDGYSSPYKHDLVISQFSKLQPFWMSEEFSAGEYRWRIMLYRYRHDSEEGRCVPIYLQCVDSASFGPHEKLLADVCIRIKNKKHYKQHCFNTSHWFSSSAEYCSWGFPEFIAVGDLRNPGRGFVVGDSCHMGIEIRIKAVVRDAPK